jgi:uncharacterized protein (DUF342 family)
MNTLTKVQIPIEKIYIAINSPKTLNAQATIDKYSKKINSPISSGTPILIAFDIDNKQTYEAMNVAVKEVSDAVKAIEAARKEVTTPLDAFKKELMKLEKDTIAPLNEFIESAKQRMVDYHEKLAVERAAAEARLREEAEAAMRQAQSINDIMASFTDSLYTTSVETNHTKNVRTTIKARTNGEVDWLKVLSVQFASGNLTAEDLLTGLPKAMKEMGVDSIDGIELYESKTQIIR